jgi:hypothetical protein
MLSMSSVVRKKLVSINRLLAASEKKVGEVNLGFLVVFSLTSLCENNLNRREHRGASRYTEQTNTLKETALNRIKHDIKSLLQTRISQTLPFPLAN